MQAAYAYPAYRGFGQSGTPIGPASTIVAAWRPQVAGLRTRVNNFLSAVRNQIANGEGKNLTIEIATDALNSLTAAMNHLNSKDLFGVQWTTADEGTLKKHMDSASADLAGAVGILESGAYTISFLVPRNQVNIPGVTFQSNAATGTSISTPTVTNGLLPSYKNGNGAPANGNGNGGNGGNGNGEAGFKMSPGLMIGISAAGVGLLAVLFMMGRRR